jgi:hypothetical protein
MWEERAQRSSLLCVGDDWQSIYGWRGSSPKYFMEFNKEFVVADHHAGDAQRQLSAAISTSLMQPNISYVPRRRSRQDGPRPAASPNRWCRFRCWIVTIQALAQS